MSELTTHQEQHMEKGKNILQGLQESLRKLQEEQRVLEVFGQITVTQPSYFRFVKYEEKVHVEAYIGSSKINKFGTFSEMEEAVETWLASVFGHN